jgi:PKD repeat protein
VNLGWEYVWHCHILAHEEMDMMHSQAIAVSPPGGAPNSLESGEITNVTTNTTAVVLTWIDNSNYESDWIIQRSNISGTGNWTTFRNVPSYSTRQTGDWAIAIDNSFPVNTTPNYTYRVLAANVVGDDYTYPAPSVGFPTMTISSAPSPTNSPVLMTPPSSATFTVNPSSGDAPLNVTFIDTSPGAIRGWDWDFGDGNFASDNGKQNPNHVYQLPGTYHVTLTVMNTAGNATSTQNSTITVTKAPVPAAPVPSFINTTPREGIAPLSVTFNADASTSLPAVWATWRWTFGDGTFSSVKNPVHTYLAPGNYTVSLAATNLGGTNVMTRVGYINVSSSPETQTGVFRDPTGTWFMDTTKTGVVNKTFQFGKSGDNPVVGDWNGDGMSNAGIFRPASGIWYLDTTNTGVVSSSFQFGKSGDNPVVGDWNGDGMSNAGIFRPASGIWYLDTTNTGVISSSFQFGKSGDIPVVGDWNGNGNSDNGVFRPATGTWYMDTTKTGVVSSTFQFGKSGDTPVVGDWNGDGIDDAGVFRSATGTWYLDTTKTGVVNKTFQFGKSGDIPVIGDWNGDGIDDVGVFRPSTGTWYLDITKTGVVSSTFRFGKSGDIPETGKWI